MYKDFGKDEMAVIVFTSVFAIVYRLLSDNDIRFINGRLAIGILIISVAYLFFNRVIKLMIDAMVMRKNFYYTFLTIQDIWYRQLGRGKYKVFMADYTDAKNKVHNKEIHSAFSIKKWKKGDRIKIKVSTKDPEKIIILFSDAAIAFIRLFVGIVFETVLFTIYINI
ncbi:MAG: hypothetical protein K5979_11550 [Ruminococcus sp.]|nr:hypothetical protein [Ruminococcus sp.]